jgi:nascent polypeptide-associated complex subunit beta
MDLSQEQIKANIAKMRAKYGEARDGGKGTERRKQKNLPKPAVDDKAIKGLYKRLGVQPIQQIDEVNMFKDDGSILHFANPEVHFNYQNHVVVVSGDNQTMTAKDLLPDIIAQLGPKQMHLLQDLISQDKGKDDAPDLVEANFEEAAQVD